MYWPDTAENPWPKEENRGAPSVKHARSFLPEQMLGAMEAIGVDRAVIVPPTWAGEDNNNRLAQDACDRYPGKFAIMGRLDPYAADAPERLEHWLEQPHMLGIRMSGRWSSTSHLALEVFDDPSLEWYWAACERLGIPLMLLTRHLVGRLGPIAERHPNLTMIVDHLSVQEGEPPTVQEAFVAIDDLVAVAKHERIFVKVGNAPNRSMQQYPFEDVQPYLRRIYDAFGGRRLMWEADITQLKKNTYAQCLRLWQEGLPFIPESEKDWIMGRTTAEVLKWPEK
jgi:predicted TIM-barrel fold metal-dependent hydrolase